jgi:type II secretory pathway pseudopilin PulG
VIRPRRDDGITLIELLVSMMLLSVVSAVVVTAVVSASRSLRRNENEAQGLSDVRVVTERLGRDIEQARGVSAPGTLAPGETRAQACSNRLTLWIDYNSDYIQTVDETVTWVLQGGSNGHYDVHRIVGSLATPSSNVIEGRTLVSNVAFSYTPYDNATDKCPVLPSSTNVPAPTSTVSTSIKYNARTASGGSDKTIDFTNRLRNVL